MTVFHIVIDYRYWLFGIYFPRGMYDPAKVAICIGPISIVFPPKNKDKK